MNTLEKKLEVAWNDTKELFSYPPLPKPEFCINTMTAAIDMSNHKIKINKKFMQTIVDNAAKKGKYLSQENVLKGLLHHEVNHYMLCPYDLATAMKIENEISKVTDDNVDIIANYFMDAVVNLDIMKRKKRMEISDVYTNFEKVHPVDKLMCALYQDKTKKNFDVNIKDNYLKKKLDKLKKINYFNSKKWISSSKKFAEIIKDLITENNKGLLNNIDGWNADAYSDSEIEKAVNDIASELDPNEFQNAIKSCGINANSLIQGIDVLYYDQQSKNYLMKVKPRKTKSRVVDYSEHKKWEISDNIQSVDIFNSYGKYMPGLTNSWKTAEEQSDDDFLSTPDLVIALDSSGSMPEPLSELSNAVLGAFCAAKIYLENNSYVATYNFSDSIYITDFSTDREKIFKNLALFQHGGTNFDVKSIEELVKTSKTKCDIIIITDMDIANFNETILYLKSIKKVNRTSILWINPDERCDVMNLKSENFFIYKIIDQTDIPKIVIGDG